MSLTTLAFYLSAQAVRRQRMLQCYRMRYRQNVPHLLWALHECVRAGRGRPPQNGLVLPSERLPCCWRRDARSKDCPGDVRARRTSGGPDVCAERESVQKLSSSEGVPLDLAAC